MIHKPSSFRRRDLSFSQRNLFAYLAVMLVLALFALMPIALTGTTRLFKSSNEIEEFSGCDAAQQMALKSAGLASADFAPSINAFHNWPRLNPLTGGQSTNSFNPIDLNYWLGISTLVGIGIVLSVLSLLIWPVFFIFRCCCNTCGKRKATKQYSSGSVRLTKILMLIVAVISFAAAALGISGNFMFNQGLSDTFGNFVNIGNDLKGTIADLNTLNSQGINITTPIPSDAFGRLDSIAGTVVSTVTGLKNLTESYSIYTMIGIIVFVIAIIAAGLGVLDIFLKRGWLSISMAVIGWLLLFLVWLLFSVYFALTIVLADVCVASDEFVGTDPASSPITSILPCPEDMNVKAEIIQNWINSTSTDTNAALNAAPIGSTLRSTLQAQLVSINSLTKVVTSLMLKCGFVSEVMSMTKNSICGSMFTGLSLLSSSCAIIGIIFIVGMFVAIKGAKKFRKYENSDYEMENF